MSTVKDFSEFCKRDLSDFLSALEKERKSVAKTGVIGFIFLGLAIISVRIGIEDRPQVFIVAFICLIPAIVMLIFFYNKKKKYIGRFKDEIIHNIIKFIDPSLRYDPAGHIHTNDYKQSGLFLEKFDRYRGDDYVEGMKGKTVFCFSELHTEREVQSGSDNSHWETIFKGLFFIGDFNKNFQGRTYVYSENNPQLGFFSKLLTSFARDLEKVKLESIEFENKFIVYSSDQVEARYILTPSFMERLVKLQTLMGDSTSYSFVDTNVYVAVPISEQLFEPSVFSANDYNKLGDYYNTVHIVFDIIEELNLNLRIWNKE